MGELDPSKLPLPIGGSRPPSNTWFPGFTAGVLNPNGISIGSAVFAGSLVWQTDRPCYSVSNSSSHLRTWYGQCGLIIVNLYSLARFCDFLPSSRHHLSYDDFLEDKRENYQNCSVLCCVRQLCTMICTYTCEQFLKTWWFRFELICVRFFTFSIFVCFLVYLRVLHYLF